jgi:hypothetical protein
VALATVRVCMYQRVTYCKHNINTTSTHLQLSLLLLMPLTNVLQISQSPQRLQHRAPTAQSTRNTRSQSRSSRAAHHFATLGINCARVFLFSHARVYAEIAPRAETHDECSFATRHFALDVADHHLRLFEHLLNLTNRARTIDELARLWFRQLEMSARFRRHTRHSPVFPVPLGISNTLVPCPSRLCFKAHMYAYCSG